MERGVYVGIDVAKATLEVALRPEEAVRSFENNDEGRDHLASWLSSFSPCLIVMEATGGYEMAVVRRLAEEKLPLVVVNARQVRDFAKATGRLAKTDTIDAQVIAWFAEAVRPEVRALRDRESEKLHALSIRQRQLIEMLSTEKNRLITALEWTKKDIGDHIVWLKDRLCEVNRDIDDLLKNSALWREKENLLRSVPGVGPVTTGMLIAQLPELGRLTRQEIASLVGVAPFSWDSGKFKGRRSIRGGRTAVRSVLYMAALASLRCNGVIRSFYLRLRASGKLPKVALVACMRKLLVILNAMMKTNTPWRGVANIA